MTQIIHTKNNKILVPDGFYKSSPLLSIPCTNLEEMRKRLQLRGGSEIEIRFIDKQGKPVYYLGKKKTNIIVANYVQDKYP